MPVEITCWASGDCLGSHEMYKGFLEGGWVRVREVIKLLAGALFCVSRLPCSAGVGDGCKLHLIGKSRV